MSKSELPHGVSPFESASELREEHAGLLDALDKQLYKDASVENEADALTQLYPRIRQFLERGAATGVYLEEIKERTACQVLLDYWVSTLSHRGIQVPGARLAKFDASQLPDLKDKPCPYVGLEAFRDQAFFFGREADTQKLLEQVRETPLVVVLGASGSGKSSLVMGGVLPALKAKEAAPEPVIVPPFVPGDAALNYLVDAVLSARPDNYSDVAGEVTRLRQDPLHLCTMVGGADAPPTVITLDQFEEVFTLSDPADRDALVANLAKLLEASRGHRVILTVREEFRNRIVQLHALERYIKPDEAWYSMRPMGYEELKAAVEKPSAAVNLQFQSGIVDDLVKKVLGQPAALPLLQFTLRSLWERRDRNRITWEVYRRVGDPLNALRASADAFYDGLAPQTQDEVRRILLELVRVDELLEAYRQPVRGSRLARAGRANTEEALKLLAENDYVRVTSGSSDADTVVEVKHEALVRNWPRFVEWIEGKRHLRLQRIALSQAAVQWAKNEKPREGLLTGWQLLEAKNQSDLSGLEKEFVQASIDAIDRIQRDKESALQHEAAQAKATARRFRRLWITTAVVALIALSAGTIAYRRNQQVLMFQTLESNMQREQLELQQQQSKVKLKESELKAQRMRIDAIAAQFREEQVTKQLETMEYTLTLGQIERFRSMAPSLDESEKTTHARNVFGSVATYLWSKKDDNSLAKLVSILKDSDDLIPEDYGIDRPAGYVMPFVKDEDQWPITIKYNPARQINQGLLQYEWRTMATYLASAWGIPVPVRLKIQMDPDVAEHDILIIADTAITGNKDDEGKPRNHTVDLATQQGQVFITTAALPERLITFVADHEKDWTRLKQVAGGGPWYLVPKWTQPLWKVAGRGCHPVEKGVALVVAKSLLEHPELILTPECVQSLLDRLRDLHPHTVEEALLARGGLKGIEEDLIEIVKKDRSLNRLEYLLDALAKYPKLSSSAAAEFADQDQGRPVELLPDRLPGLQARALVISIEKPGDKKRGPQSKEILDPAKEMLQKTYLQAYEEANPWLSTMEPQIRVYLGDPILNQLTTPKGELIQELIDAIIALRRSVKEQFGITIPSIRFRPPEDNSNKRTLREAFRIEMLNQTGKDEDAQPIKPKKGRALEEFVHELRWRSVAFRTWWLTAERTAELRGNLSPHLRNWLEKQYTLTDLKLILRAVILPDEIEQSMGWVNGTAFEIPPEHTLNHLPWLLGSLVFWTNLTDSLNTVELSGFLRETQHARINHVKEKLPADRVVELIKQGIDQYNKENIQQAKAVFSEAVTLNRPAARRAFLSLYSEESQLSFVDKLQRVEQLASLPIPGEISTAGKPDLSDRNEVEEFLKRFGSQISPERLRTFRLWLLWSYIEEKGGKKADELCTKLLAECNLNELSANESYLLAYLMLKAHGDRVVPPDRLHEIRELLLSSFKDFKNGKAELAFYEELLSPIYKEGRIAPIWYVALLNSLAEFHPQSFWISYRLGAYLTAGHYSQKELESALVLLDGAQANLTKIELEDQRRLRAWIDWSRATAFRNLSDYRHPQSRKLLLNQALDLLASLKAREEDVKGWPALGSIHVDLSLVHLKSERIDQATMEVERGIERFPESEDLQFLRCFLTLAKGKVDEALKLARGRIDKLAKEGQVYQTWFSYATMLQVLIGEGDFSHEARRYLDASYDDQDYIRMMLYWALSKQQREGEAKELLSERWATIKSSSWQARLEQGDKKVWAEMLVAYYAGKIKRQEVFGLLDDRQAFEKTKLTMTGQTFLGFQSDYFYDALLQDVSGNPADRQKRSQSSLEKVIAAQQLTYVEYHMARYLLRRLNSGAN